MNDNPMISVILPYFNGKEFIQETLKSLKKQTFRDFEVIVVDDGSTRRDDSTYLKSAIESLGDPRFVYHYKENGGLSNARNYGVKASKGAWIAFIDQDDLWDPGKLQTQVEVINQNAGVRFIFTGGKMIGDIEVDMEVGLHNGFKTGLIHDPYTRLLKGSFVICSSVLFRKSLIDTVGYSNPAYRICPDYEYIVRFAQQTDFFFIDAPLVAYRIHGGNTVKNQLKQSVEAISVLCDQRIGTRRQKLFATYHLTRNILTLTRCWITRLLSN